MKIIFLESLTKRKTIASFLDSNYKIFATHGHLWNIKNSGKYNLGVNLDNFDADYELIFSKVSIVSYWKSFFEKERKNIEIIYLATDPDREGEKIAKDIINIISSFGFNFTYERLDLQEITPSGLKYSLNNLSFLKENLIEAQISRQVLDKMIGFCISPILKKKFSSYSSVSAGRIQSFVLKMIVDREEIIKNKQNDKDFIILSSAELDGKKIFFNKVNFSPSPFYFKIVFYKNEEESKKVSNELDKEIFFFDKKQEEKLIFSAPPFTTSSLLSEAKSKLSFSISKTTSLAQKLYEGVSLGNKMIGLITYPRTDSERINKNFTDGIYKYVGENFGKDYCDFSPFWRKIVKNKINVQDAHEAIRPTHLNYKPEQLKARLSEEEYILYKLIFERTISSFMSPAKIKKIDYIFSSKDKENFFSSSEKIILFPGFFLVNSNFFNYYNVIKSSILHNVSKLEIDNKTKEWTFNKPSRYNEGTIVKELERLGIGRPSTYKTFTDTLLKRKYVFLNRDSLFFPTKLGLDVNNWIQDNFSYLINDNYTCYLEEELDKISSGKNSYKKFISDFWETFSKKINDFSQ